MIPKICNFNANCDLGVSLNLRDVALNTINVEYNPSRFYGIVKRFKSPRTTVLIFPDGKLTITGCKSQDECKRAAKKTAKMLRNLHYKPIIKDFRITNIMATYDLKEITVKKTGTIVNLDELYQTPLQEANYVNEHFTALCCKFNEITVIFFTNGKINFTSCKDIFEIYNTFDDVISHLSTYKLIEIS